MNVGDRVRVNHPRSVFDLREGVIERIRTSEFTQELVYDVRLTGERETRMFAAENLRAMR